MDFQDASAGKEFVCNAGDSGDTRFNPWFVKIPWGRKWQPTPVFLPGEFNRQRSLVGYTVYGVVKNRTQLNDFHFSLSENIEMLSRSKSKHLFRSPCMGAKLLRLYPTLCDPMDCSLPGSFVHRILQARILEWVAISSSRRSSRPRDRTWGHTDGKSMTALLLRSLTFA